MREYFPATHSTLCAEALLRMVSDNYGISTLLDCKLLHQGLNDTYLLRADANSNYIMRVYRTKWRSLEDILYELEVLMHLHKKGAHVSIPLLRNDSELINPVDTIEGARYAVLFTFASGNEPRYENENQAIQYGRGVASVHSATDGFISRYSRFSLDLDHLIHAPMKAIQPMLSGRAQDWEYLEKLHERICSTFSTINLQNLEQGFCHGDFNGGNASFADEGTVTFYDFDCCGFGWRSYDLAVFRWCAILHNKDKELWNPFLQGYREVKELKQSDLDAVPLFIGARHIWIMGLHAANAYDLGYGWLNDNYFDHQMKFLHKWETELLNEKIAG
jgi:Ser/Thr protein kinase RdoA (MazF antagonist)